MYRTAKHTEGVKHYRIESYGINISALASNAAIFVPSAGLPRKKAMNKQSIPQLLVCTAPAVLATAHDILNEHYNCSFSLTAGDARALLDVRPDAIVCCMQFDEGRMLDFLAYVKTHPYGREVPFIVVQSNDSLTPHWIKSIEEAARLLGIEAFIEVLRWEQEFGYDIAKKRIRAIIDLALINTTAKTPMDSIAVGNA